MILIRSRQAANSMAHLLDTKTTKNKESYFGKNNS